MKTSHILLILIALITLTGMVATDVLLKQQYDQIDWRNPYQHFDRRNLPAARHWVLEGTPTAEIMVLESTDSTQALIDPEYARFFRTRQRGDTMVVAFTPDDGGYKSDPRSAADYELNVQLVLRLPNWQTLRMKDSRVTLSALNKDSLRVTLQNSRLRTVGAGQSGAFMLVVGQNSFAALGPDQYQSLQATVQDSSGLRLDDTQVGTLTMQNAPRAEVQMKGRAFAVDAVDARPRSGYRHT